jgi:thiol-disulfide isomerase/thioredoxin
MMKYLFIYLIIICSIFSQSSNIANDEPNYIPAYDFNLSLFDDSKKDSLITLSSLKGNVVLLNFWATWCGPCIAEIPEFNELYNKYKSEGFEILGISISDNYKQLKKFSNKIDVQYKMLFGSSKDIDTIVQNYGGFYSVPVSYLINREGLVVRGYPGAILGEYWTSLLHNDLLKFLSIPYSDSNPNSNPLDTIKIVD